MSTAGILGVEPAVLDSQQQAGARLRVAGGTKRQAPIDYLRAYGIIRFAYNFS